MTEKKTSRRRARLIIDTLIDARSSRIKRPVQARNDLSFAIDHLRSVKRAVLRFALREKGPARRGNWRPVCRPGTHFSISARVSVVMIPGQVNLTPRSKRTRAVQRRACNFACLPEWKLERRLTQVAIYITHTNTRPHASTRAQLHIR